MMTNQEIKDISKLKLKKFRNEAGMFIIEGTHLIEECAKSEFFSKLMLNIVIRNDFPEDKIPSAATKLNIPVHKLNLINFNRLCETKNPQGILAVVKFNSKVFLKELFCSSIRNSDIVVALEGISDPGNLGTILRTMWWFGINNVLLDGNCVEIYNDKVLRASQGAVFNINIWQTENLTAELESLKKMFRIVATSLESSEYFENYSFSKDEKYLLIFGNETQGISNEIMNIKNINFLKIRGYSNCESLNVSVSSAVAIHHILTNLKK